MTATTPISLHINQQNFIELSGVEQFSDGSGYRANLAITSWPFSCAEHRFYFQDLAGFTKDLKQVHERVQGKVRLAEMYEKDYIEIEVGKLGHVMVSGSIRQWGQPTQELRFGFECDQTYLVELLGSLNKVAKAKNWQQKFHIE